jgi:hypothetical protein
MRPTLRPARREDSEFVFQVKKAALGKYIEQTWGWDEGFQRDLHVRDYDPTTTEIISWQGADVGWLESTSFQSIRVAGWGQP